MSLRPLGVAFTLSLVAASGGWAQTGSSTVVLSQPIRSTGSLVDLNLQEADAATLTQKLGSALGGTVRIEGTVPGPVTLDLAGATARGALDAVARALYGTWHPVYTVTAGVTAGDGPRPLPLGRTVTANLTDVSARAAFALVARAGGGTLELPSGIDKSLSLVARDLPVETALDELAKQAGASWSVTYLLTPGVGPAVPARPRPAARSGPLESRPLLPRLGQPDAPAPAAVLNGGRSFPIPGTAPGTGANAGGMLALGLSQVMKMPAAQRKGAVKDFALQLDQQFRQMKLMTPQRRLEQMNAMQPVYQAALHTYNGLTPAQRHEFQPIIDVFNRWLR